MPNSYIAKDLVFDKDARKRIAAGADKLARAVICTFGPRSNNVAIHQGSFSPRVVHDGVTVAREIRLIDRYEDLGCMLIREAATKTNDLAGDGTTTATLIANTLVQEGLKLIDNKDELLLTKKQGVNKMVLREDLLKFAEIIDKEIDKLIKKVETDEELMHIAKISAADPGLGQIIAEAWSKIGIEGQVIVEPFIADKDEAEVSRGYSFDNGFFKPHFAFDQDRQVTEANDAYVLFADYKFFGAQELLNIVSEVFESENGKHKKPLIIIANDISGPAMNALLVTRIKLGYDICAVMAPEFAERQQQLLDDMALLTGGVVANPTTLPIQDVHIGHLGRIKNVFIDARSCTFTPAEVDNEELQARIEEIKKQLKAEKTEWIQDKIKERLAKLSQSIAVLRIAGASQLDFDNRRERAIDAVFATRAALEDGYVPGGGITLMQVARNLGQEQAAGLLPEVFDLVQQTLRRPFELLLETAAADLKQIESEIVWRNGDQGYDIVKKEIVNVFDDGLIDPVKVTKIAVSRAFSVAATILTTAAAIVDIEDDHGERKL